jgi:hypothetical protein
LALSIGGNFPYEDLSRWDNANNTFTNNEQNIALMDGVTLGFTGSLDILAPDYTWRDTIMGLPVVVSQLVVAGRVIIPAGTTVRSVPSGRHGRFQVVSRGVLVAQGTAANPIRFTCTDPSLRWSGLTVMNGGTAELENCIIERALTAIHPFTENSMGYSGVVTVRNCTITDGGTGIYEHRDPTTYLGQPSSLTVENTTFRNLVTGIVASPRFNAITGCRFENLQVAIRLRPSTGGNTFAADDLNRISNNTYINNAVNIVFGGHTDFLLRGFLNLAVVGGWSAVGVG